MYFDVLYNALKDDYSVPRVKAFVKRILQVAIHSEPPFAISSLLLVAKLFQTHPGSSSLLKFSDHNKFNNEVDDETFKDIPDEDDKGITQAPSAQKADKQAKTNKVNSDTLAT